MEQINFEDCSIPSAVPYGLLRSISRKIAPDIPRLSFLKLAVISLLVNDPARILPEVLLTYSYLKDKLTEEEWDENTVLKFIYQTIKPTLEDAISAAYNDMSNILASLPESRISKSLLILRNIIQYNLNRRLESPWFEVDMLSAEEGYLEFSDLMRNTPCIILQQKRGSRDEISRDSLVCWGDIPEEDFFVLQCAMDFAAAHQKSNDLGFMSTEEREKFGHHECPFYTMCDLKLRKLRPDICSRYPWRSANWEGWEAGKTCSYGNGVIGSIGY